MKKNEDGTFNVTTNELGDLMKDVVKKTLEEIQPKKKQSKRHRQLRHRHR